MSPLKIGDVVRLNSGGPKMIVVDNADEEPVFAWKDRGEAREIILPAKCVLPVDPLEDRDRDHGD